MEKITLGSIGSNLLANANEIKAVQLTEGNVIKNTGIVVWTLFKSAALLTNLAAHTGIWAHNQAVRTKPYNFVASSKIVDLVSTETAMEAGDSIAMFGSVSWDYAKQVFTRSKHEDRGDWYDRVMASDALTKQQKSSIKAAGTRDFNKKGHLPGAESKFMFQYRALRAFIAKHNLDIK